jgi:hypothetical protein
MNLHKPIIVASILLLISISLAVAIPYTTQRTRSPSFTVPFKHVSIQKPIGSIELKINLLEDAAQQGDYIDFEIEMKNSNYKADMKLEYWTSRNNKTWFYSTETIFLPSGTTKIKRTAYIFYTQSSGPATVNAKLTYKNSTSSDAADFQIGTHSTIIQNSDDGTEVNNQTWYNDGYKYTLNYIGSDSNQYDTGLRFLTPSLKQGEEITFARLRLASNGSSINSQASLTIEGVLLENPSTFSQSNRPSQLPKTNTKTNWTVADNLEVGHPAFPIYYSTPNIAPIINEILSLPNWGSGEKSIAITITSSSTGTNYVKFDDFKSQTIVTAPAILEIYKTPYETFRGKEILGRVTDTSAVVSLYPLMEMEVSIEYGQSPNSYPLKTPLYQTLPEKTKEILLENLKPDTRYYYRLAYRVPGSQSFEKSHERTFHTQRSPGSSFSFAVQADSHLVDTHRIPKKLDYLDIYKISQDNIQKKNPDFLISLGDFVGTQVPGLDSKSQNDSIERYLIQREAIDDICHSIPFFLVLGNHEGEQGWQDQEFRTNNILARKEIITNPEPDSFYSGNTEVVPGAGLMEDYYAWEWGDALFVVIDPFPYTEKEPMATHDGWDWTIGEEQYNWLYNTLHNSKAEHKIIFTHHLTSTTTVPWMDASTHYGRGGTEVAKYKVDDQPSHEWGGEDQLGNNIFSQMRPNWTHGPIHDMLVTEGANIVFHGHDHTYAAQVLDSVVYQETPEQTDTHYTIGFKKQGLYSHGTLLKNSGHLQVAVEPESIKVDYVRVFLPGDGENGEISHTYIIEQNLPQIRSFKPRGRGVARNTNISFTIRDKSSGINISSLSVQINSQKAIENGEFQPGFSGQIAEKGSLYKILIDPDNDFDAYQTVNTTVQVSDSAIIPNNNTKIFSFKTGSMHVGRTI